MQQALSHQGPTYAQNRFTRTPEVLNAPGQDPGSAVTQAVGQHGPLGDILNRIRTSLPMLKRGDVSSLTTPGLISVGRPDASAGPGDVRDTLRHETIHSVLTDMAGMDDGDFNNLYKNSTAGKNLLQAWKSAGRVGNPMFEIPAYIRGDAKFIPAAKPQDVQQFRKETAEYLRTVKKNPKAADLYLKMQEP